ncbi:putative serine/threonine-protein kinase [Pseudocercospora fuligena]|uniref:Putative serine/threonine-protein kinase n=1 Tax=Pseudocercospora fuligena TaxID=685502 RepID=A0A8H6VNJ7_9PEZI|nr:putative serine/threonine-protein kinase [Pseudocercospora fuligena]
MPNLFPFASHHANSDALQDMGIEELPPKRLRRSSLLRKPLSLWRRYHAEANELDATLPQTAPTELSNIPEYFVRRPSLPDNLPTTRRAIPSLPRPQTFRRQNSERRDKLLEVPPTPLERRAVSADRRTERGFSASAISRHLSPQPVQTPSNSAPNVTCLSDRDTSLPSNTPGHSDDSVPRPSRNPADLPPLQIPESINESPLLDEDRADRDSQIDKTSLQEEHDRRWILNLSMHFRDKSNREKFFVTYAEKPNQWRRVTVSLDYRNAPADSLEADLSTLSYQRDKSLRIYEAIRDSLPEIQYYPTVTNLKLETTQDDGQLHVHVREDANEIINYPSRSLFDHVACPRFSESQLEFISHLSGFVYKVRLDGRVVIKKEIPGPDTIDEFLYEVNALDSLQESRHVVRLEGLVMDDRGELVKGLLLSYASKGALVDMIYDFRGSDMLSWERREKWAKQIVSGLSDIHEAGFVQGDFTLSNIVIDEDDNAQIIDINRRGCPVGWEPPELGRLIDSGQRIGMCIGVKTDIFQLGMVLWALAEEVDEPERVERPLPPVYEGTPDYFRQMIQSCLSERPQGRKSAQQLLHQFPACAGLRPPPPYYTGSQHESKLSDSSMSTSTHRPKKQYIDPEMAVTIEDVREGRMPPLERLNIESAVTYVDPNSNPASTTYQCESTGSWVIPGRRHSRGRSPVSSRRRRSSPYGRTVSSATSFTQESPTRRYAFDDDESCSEAADIKPLERKSTSETLMEPPGPSALPESADMDSATALPSSKAPMLRRRDTWPSREFLHTDSGFDESMIEEIERGRPSTPPEQGSTPSSYHTPATHYDGDAKHSDDTTIMNYEREGAGIPDSQHGAMALGHWKGG